MLQNEIIYSNIAFGKYVIKHLISLLYNIYFIFFLVAILKTILKTILIDFAHKQIHRRYVSNES